ncbi:MAG: thioredoxin domain-containing protein [Ferruginibacter sp.]|jgi:protein-disulfide isomerase
MSLKPAVGNNDHMQGNAASNVVIVEYGDYQCPYCGAAHPVIKQIMQEFGSQVKFVFRNFPLSEMHQYALPAALAAEAAALQGKFWEMHDAIFEQQEYLSEPFLTEIAKSLQLNLHEFKNDTGLQKLADKVDEDFESGMRSGVNGTPTFFMNGHKFQGDATDLLERLRSGDI